MIKGLAITPPVIGRIVIGHIAEKNGKRLPEKDDYFTITTQIQNWEGWILHPLQNQLAEGTPNGKVRAIPIRLLFNAPDLNPLFVKIVVTVLKQPLLVSYPFVVLG